MKTCVENTRDVTTLVQFFTSYVTSRAFGLIHLFSKLQNTFFTVKIPTKVLFLFFTFLTLLTPFDSTMEQR